MTSLSTHAYISILVGNPEVAASVMIESSDQHLASLSAMGGPYRSLLQCDALQSAVRVQPYSLLLV